MQTYSDLLLISGNSNPELSEEISRHLGIPLGKALVSTFADEETRVELQSNVRGKDVFIIQSLSRPANHHIMEALIIADACRRSSADRMTLVMPYYGYARQERKSLSRTPITAKLIADLFVAGGIDRILTVELHAAAIQGFFNIPVDHLFAKNIFATALRQDQFEDLLVVSPDAGGVERARAFAKLFNSGIAIVDKRRERPNESDVINVVGDVKGKNCFILDDIVDTGGSLVKAAEALKKKGARSVMAGIVHPVLSRDALARIENSCLEHVYITDSIKTPESKKLRKLSLGPLLAEAIRRIHRAESISSLFDPNTD